MALLVVFIGAVVLLPVYYLYLKKRDTEFSLRNQFKTPDFPLSNEKRD